MTDAERIARVQGFFDEGVLSDSEAEAYLAVAKDAVLNTLYAFAANYPEEAEVPARYEGLMCELAARRFSRKGGLGETMHIENGIHRDWYSSDDSDLLRMIVPYAVVR